MADAGIPVATPSILPPAAASDADALALPVNGGAAEKTKKRRRRGPKPPDRRPSLSKAARDPLDEPSEPSELSGPAKGTTQSPSPLAESTDALAPLGNGVPSVGEKTKKKRRRANRRHSMSKAARDPRDEPPESSKVTTRSSSPAVAAPSAVVEKSEKAVVARTHARPPARTLSPVIDFDGLSRPSTGTRARLEESAEEADVRRKKMGAAVRTLLECVGEDPERSGLLGTPDRYANALLFFTQGYQQNVRDIVNDAIFHENHNEMVIVKDIEIYSMCEHHMVPFTGKMHIGYIPFHSVIGISKLPRIAEMFSRRLQIQERLTKEVANAIMEVLQPQGVAVVMESSHLCMVMRGVEKSTATTITSCVLGCFERKEKTRNEFLNLIGVNRR